MALSLGLMISLGFTTLLCVLLFFYIRQRTSSIDTKITKLFKVLQDEVSKNNSTAYITSQRPQPQQQNMTVTEIENKNTIQSQEEKNEEPEYSDSTSTNDSDEKDGCGSSDDSDSDIGGDDEDDLISVSTGISETDGETHNDYNDEFVEHQNVNDDETGTNAIKVIQQKQDIENVLKNGNLETITDLNLYTNILKNKDELNDGELSNISDLESLELADEHNDDDSEDDNEDHNDDVGDDNGHDVNRENNEGDYENNGNDHDNEYDNGKQTTIDSIINYKKLSVTKLREIVKKNNLHENPQKLKKNELVKLLES